MLKTCIELFGSKIKKIEIFDFSDFFRFFPDFRGKCFTLRSGWVSERDKIDQKILFNIYLISFEQQLMLKTCVEWFGSKIKKIEIFDFSEFSEFFRFFENCADLETQRACYFFGTDAAAIFFWLRNP